ncbi:MAG: A/G-specific adenine glycosylase [Planctomycetaceae bacterium]
MSRQDGQQVVARKARGGSRDVKFIDPIPDQPTLQRLRRKLVAWYAHHGRDLPWRRTRDPYRIWISEIMLQQTTVKAVIGYYQRFFEAFPTLQSLADAPEERVLRLWEGLGYYSRARNIHRAARELVNDHHGKFPKEVDSLLGLPGVGRYTAGAIASFAFDERAPIVEANTIRLYSRLLGYREDPRAAPGQQLLWSFAERILPEKSPGQFNHALMDLGATVCTPSAPDCPNCPLMRECAALRDGTQNEIPLAKQRVEPTLRTEAAIAIRRGNSFLLMQRPVGTWWAGLWDFPRFALDEDSRLSVTVKRKLQEQILDQTGLVVEIGDLITEMKHTVTRYRIRLLCLRAEHRQGEPADEPPFQWVKPGNVAGYPLSTTGRKLANLLK